MYQIPSLLKKRIETSLKAEVTGFKPAGGGCINNGGELKTNQGSYFIKWNSVNLFPGMFDAEARGLRLLHSKRCISIPEVIQVNEGDSIQFILMEFVASDRTVKKYWELFGSGLAKLHKNSQSEFGLDHDNFIGSLPQQNGFRNAWVDFFIEQRLNPQLELAEKNHLMDQSSRNKFELLNKKLPEFFPVEPPALLHGDLWSGNLITNRNGEPCLIDPAIYFGHREAELAFTRLFGGFERAFYYAYHNAYPLQPGFEKRIDLYNLYPLLVHANLFGGSYFQQVKSILDRHV